MAFETLLLEVDDEGVATLTLNRPEKHNAINLAMVSEFHDVLGGLEEREDLRALVVTSAGGKAFVSGADVAELRDRRREDAQKGINAGLFARVERFPRPTVAAVDGWCLGGGLELATACDFRVASEGSRFGQPEVALGIMPAAGGTRRLPALVGLAAARRLLLFAEIVDAEEALRIGLVDRVVPRERVLSEARALLAPILRQAPEAIRRTKQALLAWMHGATERQLRRLDNDLQAELFEHPEKLQRMDAFLERRARRRGDVSGRDPAAGAER